MEDLRYGVRYINYKSSISTLQDFNIGCLPYKCFDFRTRYRSSRRQYRRFVDIDVLLVTTISNTVTLISRLLRLYSISKKRPSRYRHGSLRYRRSKLERRYRGWQGSRCPPRNVCRQKTFSARSKLEVRVYDIGYNISESITRTSISKVKNFDIGCLRYKAR